MKYVLEVASTLTDRYQTTIPKAIRGVLKLKKRDKLRYEIMADGTVLLGNARFASLPDLALAAFLHFLAGDIQDRPDALQNLDKKQLARARAIVGNADVDLEQRLDPADGHET
jgi:antitoxin PrlF